MASHVEHGQQEEFTARAEGPSDRRGAAGEPAAVPTPSNSPPFLLTWAERVTMFRLSLHLFHMSVKCKDPKTGLYVAKKLIPSGPFHETCGNSELMLN